MTQIQNTALLENWEFSSQNLCQDTSERPIIPAPGDPMPSAGLCTQAHAEKCQAHTEFRIVTSKTPKVDLWPLNAHAYPLHLYTQEHVHTQTKS